MLTQNEIARRAGLSRMTVYRYLSGQKVSKKSRASIEEVLTDSEYRPNLTARSLVLKRTNLVGLLVPSVSYSFYADLIQVIQRSIKESGYNLLLTVSNEDPKQEKEEIDVLLSIPVDGIIVIPTSSEESEDNCAILAREKLPFIMVDRYFEKLNASYVVTDAYAASKNIVQYLIDLGHRKIVHFGGSASNSFARDVRRGYIDALKQNKIQVDDALLFSGSMEGADAPDVFSQVLEIEETPTAIQAVNDVNAIAIFEEAKKNNIRIPEEISVVGFSDIRTSHLLEIPLTTVREQVTEMGQEAARMLVARMEGKRKRKEVQLLQGELIIRKSVKALH